jgi:hypothetical protein
MWNAIGPYTGLKQWGGITGPIVNVDNPYQIKYGSYCGTKTTMQAYKRSVWC